MAFQCPICSAADALAITHVIDLPPDEADELTLQVVACGRCDFHGAAIYEERRWGRLDSESVDHVCFAVDANDWARLRSLIERCTDHREPHCTCAAHQALGARDERGRWQKPVRPAGDIYPMVLHLV